LIRDLDGEGVLIRDLLDPAKGGAWQHRDLTNKEDEVFADASDTFKEFANPDPDMRLVYLGNQDDDTFSLAMDCPASNQVIVAFRGTDPLSPENILTDVNIAKTKWTLDGKDCYVHEGYYKSFELAVEEDLEKSVKSVVDRFPDRRLLITGHSLGGGLATLLGAYLSVKYPDNNVRVINFGSPRVGDQNFKDFCETRKNLRHTRIINHKDIVPRMFLIGYKHVGHLVYYSPDKELPDKYRFGKGTPLSMYFIPPFQVLSPGDHVSEDGYIGGSKRWADAVLDDKDMDGS